MSPDTIGTTIISPTYRFRSWYCWPTMTLSIRSFSRYGLMIPSRLVVRMATRTTETWNRYGRKKPTMRRTVAARRSLGTRVKSSAGGVRRPGPALPRAMPRTPPPRRVMARTWHQGERGAVGRAGCSRASGHESGRASSWLPGRLGRPLGEALGLEPPLGVDRRLAAVARCGHRLAVAVVVDVARDEHAVDPAARVVVRDQVALGVDVEPVPEHVRV